MSRTDRIKRITRLLGHYRRVRDEKAGALADAAFHTAAKRTEAAAAVEAHRRSGEFLVVPEGRPFDLQLIRTANAYRGRLKRELIGIQAQLRELERELAARRHETTEAYRTHKIWEIVKDKLAAAETDEVTHANQRELDELAQQRQHRRAGDPASGIKRRSRR